MASAIMGPSGSGKTTLLNVLAGLDAFQAEQVMETLRYLAQDGHTVICSIHHSRGSVYAKFDDVVLLAGGSLIYAGPANDEVLAYFSKFGKNPFMFIIWDDLTDNEGVVLLQLLHEHTVILAKRVAVTAYRRDMETLAEKILAMRAEQVYETVVVQENASN